MLTWPECPATTSSAGYPLLIARARSTSTAAGASCERCPTGTKEGLGSSSIQHWRANVVIFNVAEPISMELVDVVSQGSDGAAGCQILAFWGTHPRVSELPNRQRESEREDESAELCVFVQAEYENRAWV